MKDDVSNITSLISQIHAGTSSFLREELKKQGLPELVSSHGNILFRLSKCDRLSMGELARQINRDKSTATVLVKKLEQEGYVRRVPSETDNRVTFIELSDKGREYTAATANISALLNQRCCNGLSREELQTAYGLLVRINNNFN